ncbi:type II toxin-antitoxin system RelE/ParE family toxin [Candidatus Micrarchaeota archaeon]|nr:type II toxin-antitoxin system RelE/ParE family toxin [Candidatus Micrarchaeota archaeon]
MEVLYSNHFQKSFRKLPRNIRVRLLREVTLLGQFPRAGKRLHGRLSNFFSLRVGDYRIIYSLSKNAVRLHDAGHRQNIYS